MTATHPDASVSSLGNPHPAAAVDVRDAGDPLILTLDVGSSSVRALLYDRHGHAIAGATAREPYEMRTTADGGSEMNAEALLDRVAVCIDRVMQTAGPWVDRVSAVAVDTFVTNLLGVDRDGRPLTPVYTYADTRSSADADGLRSQVEEHDVHERTGAFLRSSYWPARFAWLRRVQPRLFDQVDRWITVGEYLELCLFGRCRVTFSVASWSGLLDRRRLEWDQPLLRLSGVRDSQLSPLVDVDEPLRGLVAPYASRWPSLRNVPWYPAVGDGVAANVGSGCTSRDRVALTIGTSGALRMVTPGVPPLPPGLWCYRVDRYNALLGGATNEGGNLYAWLSQTMRYGGAAEVEAALGASTPDGHGLTVLPFVAGERSPGWAGNVAATFHGVTLSTSPVDLLRASLEAVAYRFALIHGRLEEGAGDDHTLIASGTALLNSPVWMQIVADVLGRPVVASDEPEATSRGMALLALRALGVVDALDTLPARDGACYEPDAGRHDVYQAGIARQQRLYQRLIGEPF